MSSCSYLLGCYAAMIEVGVRRRWHQESFGLVSAHYMLSNLLDIWCEVKTNR